MRPGWFVVALAGCSFEGTGGPRDGGADAPGTPVRDGGADAAGVIGWQLHTTAELEDDGADPEAPATFGGGVIHRDLIEPAAWAIGGLWTRASNDNFFTIGSTTWATVSAYAPTASPAIALPIYELAQGMPGGLGLNSTDTFTVWSEGQIYLEAGLHSFALDVDSAGFLEIDADGLLRRFEDSAATLPVGVPFTVTTAGWFPIRFAVSNQSSSSWLRISHAPPGAASDAPLSMHRLRAPTTGIDGVVRLAWDSEELGRLRGTALFTGALVDETYDNGQPEGLGLTNGDFFSQRFAGQVWIDETATYAGNVISDDGFRFALDGVWLVDDLGGSSQTTPLPERELERGWHDLVFDHQENSGGAHVELQQISGDTIGPIPAARLRPASTTAERLAIGASSPLFPGPQIPGSVDVPLRGPDDAVLVGLTIAIDAPGAHWDDDTVDLTTPWGETIRVRDRVNAGGAVVIETLTAAELDPDEPRGVAGTWRVAIDDVAGGDDGAIGRVELTARYRGGFGPITSPAVYTSGVHDFGEPRAVSGVVVRASTPPGSTVALAVRACDALPCTGTFVGIEALPLAPARYAQLQVTLGSDGNATPFVDDIDVYVLP